MSEVSADPHQRDQLRSHIEAFINERLQAKLDKVGEASAQQEEARQNHQREAWLADAARRVAWIQLATHTVKPLHPDARGSSIYLQEPFCTDATLVGSHLLEQQRSDDVVGNAAALDVYKLLKLAPEGATLLKRMLDGDPAVAAALSDDFELAQRWIQAFTGVVRSDARPSSHSLGKQLYFPVDADTYHLLAPLFPTSLVHRVHERLRADREQMFASRAAYKAATQPPKTGRGGLAATEPVTPAQVLPYREYPNLVVQNFGGSKPQNISQLNSERRGESHLLPCLPPIWNSDPVRPPLGRSSVLDAKGPFASRRVVRELTERLREFLVRVADRNNIRIRNARADIVQQIIDELLDYAARVQELKPGWSADDTCRLDAAEIRWLDPGAGAQSSAVDWREQIAHRFGNWLNSVIRTDRTPLDAVEHNEWKQALLEELADES